MSPMLFFFCFFARTFLQPFCAVPLHRRGQDQVQGHTWANSDICLSCNAQRLQITAFADLRRPTWGQVCLRSYWNFALHAANLPNTKWIKRALAWQPLGDLLWVNPAKCGHLVSRHLLAGKKRWDSWEATTLDNRLWNQSRDEFCQFVIGQRA